MTRATRIGLSVFATLIGLLLLILGIVLAIWFNPSLVLREPWVRAALEKQQSFVVFPNGLPAHVRLSARNERLIAQSVEFELSPFCADIPDFGISFCASRFRVHAGIRLIRWGVGVERIGPIDVEFTRVVMKPVSKPKTKPRTTPEKPARFRFELLGDLNLEPIRLVVQDGVVDPDRKPIRFSGQLGFSQSKDPQRELDFSMDAQAKLPFEPKTVRLQGKGGLSKTDELSLEMKLAALSGQTRPGANLEFGGAVNIRTGDGRLSGKGVIQRLIPLLPRVTISEFRLVRDKRLKLQAKLDTELAVGSPVSPQKQAMPNPVISTRASVSAIVEEMSDGRFQLGFELAPVRQYGVELNAKLSADWVGSALQLRESRASLRINEFADVVRSLSKTQFAVPAPFNSLRGQMEFKVLDPDSAISGVPFSFQSNLRSTRQALVTRADGAVTLSSDNRPVSAQAKLVLREVMLEAPELSPITPMPSVGGDSRIITPSLEAEPKTIVTEIEKSDSKSESSKSAGDSFPWSIDIATEQPIRILYSLFRPNAPFHLTGRISSSEPAQFQANFQPMKIEYLSRTANLDHLTVDLQDALLVNGRLSIKRTDCTIYANLRKTQDGTTFQLTSEPAFDEDDIVAMLLFNERASDLDDGSKRSVEDTRMAVSRKSLGFFSFFVLASTPVESVAYNPTTRVYSARVRLPGGFSATVGSDWDKTQEVGLMKRLGGKWILSVGTSTDSEGTSRQESMIEWWNRY